jgi:peptidoglycan/LPS O-acetylase OafA/YrhL
LGGILTSRRGQPVLRHNQVFGEFSFINSVAWSLEAGFQFYLLAPLLTPVFAVRRQWLRWVIPGSVCGWVACLRDLEVRRVQLSLLGQFEAFAEGLAVVDINLTKWVQGPPRKVWLARRLGNRRVFTLGGRCCGFSLWHQLLLIGAVPWLQARSGPADGCLGRYLLAALLVVPPVWAVCTAFFVWVEKPFMRRD